MLVCACLVVTLLVFTQLMTLLLGLGVNEGRIFVTRKPHWIIQLCWMALTNYYLMAEQKLVKNTQEGGEL